MKRPARFVLVGSGWRSLYYVRIARALPDRFELAAMLCRTPEKADLMARENRIHTTTSIEECVSLNPDFIVVAVDKPHLAEVSETWLDRGFPVLSETPAAIDHGTLKRLARRLERREKYAVNEQYRFYPWPTALLPLIRKGLIGEPQFSEVSLAHEYHGISLIRGFLEIPCEEEFTVEARRFESRSVVTGDRYHEFFDGRTAVKRRTLASFAFDSGKAALYDFDSDQYRSSIRSSYARIQGIRGEIADCSVRWLDGEYRPHSENIEIQTRTVKRDEAIATLQTVEEIEAITFQGETLYQAPFGLCGLNEDETAMAVMMDRMADWIGGSGEEPYPIRDALIDAWSALCLQESAETGKPVSSRLADLFAGN